MLSFLKVIQYWLTSSFLASRPLHISLNYVFYKAFPTQDMINKLKLSFVLLYVDVSFIFDLYVVLVLHRSSLYWPN